MSEPDPDLIKKIRRRCEDALRKADSRVILVVAQILKVKTTD